MWAGEVCLRGGVPSVWVVVFVFFHNFKELEIADGVLLVEVNLLKNMRCDCGVFCLGGRKEWVWWKRQELAWPYSCLKRWESLTLVLLEPFCSYSTLCSVKILTEVPSNINFASMLGWYELCCFWLFSSNSGYLMPYQHLAKWRCDVLGEERQRAWWGEERC